MPTFEVIRIMDRAEDLNDDDLGDLIGLLEDMRDSRKYGLRKYGG